MYQIDNFSFSYPFSPNKIQLNGQLIINQGDKLLIQGVSGSGKSTLLLALSGIIPNLIHGQYSGTILFNNQNITTLNQYELCKIGYLGQNQDHQLICNLVHEELAFGLENQGFGPKEIRLKIQEISSLCGISKLLMRPVTTLSGGEKQKINLISILLMDPEILLLDEPTAFLDPDSATTLMGIVKQFCQNKTVIVIEHNIRYLKEIINRSILIDKNGTMVEQDIALIDFHPQLPDMPSKHMTLEANTKPLLKIKQLNYAYKKQDALFNNLGLDIIPGQIIGILGENGSGKSTLLKLISKIIKSQNSIFLSAQDITQIPSNNYWQQVALVWQNPENHFLYNTVMEELEHDGRLIQQFHLPPNTNPFSLSEGQKRRLSLAISLKHDVDLFLLDEPTFGQDDENKLILSTLISHLVVAKQKSFIIVSHDTQFISSLTQHIYKLKDGKLHNWSKHINEDAYVK